MFIKKYQLVEFIIPQNYPQSVYNFQDIPFLRGVQILGLEVYSSSDMSTSPAQQIPLSVAQIQNTYLTLYTNDPDGQRLSASGAVLDTDKSELFQNVPLIRLRNCSDYTAGHPFTRTPFDLAGQTISWDKSKVIFGAPLGNNANPVSLILGVIYQGTALT
jgi:hypothetical protein